MYALSDFQVKILKENFYKIDLYTNGYNLTPLANMDYITHVTISLPSFRNQELFKKDIGRSLNDIINDIGLLISSGKILRLSLIICKSSQGDSIENICDYIDEAKSIGVHSVVLRELSKYSSNYEWYKNNYIDLKELKKDFLDRFKPDEILKMPWETEFYDYNGIQTSFYLSDERRHVGKRVRTLFYFPDQFVYSDFVKKASIVF